MKLKSVYFGLLNWFYQRTNLFCMTVCLWHLTSVWGQARVQGGCQCRLHGRCLDRKQYKWGVSTKTEASKKWFENAQSQYNSSVFWSLSCLRLDDNHNSNRAYSLLRIRQVLLFFIFQKRQWNQCMRAIKRNAPCLLFDTRLAQCAVTVAARCIRVHCVHILGPVSTADSGLAPHSPC